jgi:ParB/RepB/Spo0J family partition protein
MENKLIKLKLLIVNRIVKAITKPASGIVILELSQITVSGNNMRKSGNDVELQELADSIRQTGVLQPVLVRPKGKQYEIVCGERRFRASVLAKTGTIPAIIRRLSDDEALETCLIENLQRKDVSPIEEATAYKRLTDTGRYDVASLAVRFGKSETYIRNRMKLNDLTDDLLNLVNEDALSISAALELCKYSVDIQSDIYEKHLTATSDCRNDWRSLGNREFITRLETTYCSDLSRYGFDKSECTKCSFNTNCYTLFVENEGRCNNLKCLTEKNEKYCKMQDNNMKLRCLSNNENNEVSVKLPEQKNTKTDNFPVKLSEQEIANDYVDLTEAQKQKLAQCYHNTHIIRYEYVPQEQLRANGYLCFILDKDVILCESDIKHIKKVAKQTNTAFTIGLYKGDFICVCFFATC